MVMGLKSIPTILLKDSLFSQDYDFRDFLTHLKGPYDVGTVFTPTTLFGVVSVVSHRRFDSSEGGD